MKKVSISSVELVPLMVETLKKNQSISFKVSGTSMLPFFKHQKTNVKLMKKSKPYQKGDVVLFEYMNSYRLHRIIKIKEDNIIASGDNLLSKEEFKASQIIGYVESFENKSITKSNSISYRMRYTLWRMLKPIILRLKRG